MLTVPSLQEDPLPAIELLRQYAATGGETPSRKHRTSGCRATGRDVSRAPDASAPLALPSAATVWLLIRWTQRAIAYRERARLKQALLYTRCRRIALAMGDRAVRGRHASPAG